MNDRLPCEFFLIRYTPDAAKGEFVNIGVVLREPTRPESAQVRFTRDWSRVRCIDPDADIGLLEAFESEIANRLPLGALDPKPVLEQIADSFSNSIQMSEPRACLAESVPAELDLLMKLYVEPLRAKQERRRTGRAAIAAAMRSEFERAGVWGLMRKRISASLYTRPGDPLKFDCGYRPDTGVPGEPVREGGNGVIRIFHAVSLEGDLEAAKVLSFSAPRLQEGIQRVENATLELTAVVEPLRGLTDIEDEGTQASEPVERYRFGVETMEGQAIRVLTVRDLSRAAETARKELRL